MSCAACVEWQEKATKAQRKVVRLLGALQQIADANPLVARDIARAAVKAAQS